MPCNGCGVAELQCVPSTLREAAGHMGRARGSGSQPHDARPTGDSSRTEPQRRPSRSQPARPSRHGQAARRSAAESESSPLQTAGTTNMWGFLVLVVSSTGNMVRFAVLMIIFLVCTLLMVYLIVHGVPPDLLENLRNYLSGLLTALFAMFVSRQFRRIRRRSASSRGSDRAQSRTGTQEFVLAS